ncbi:acyl-CoA dehydrogenase [Paenibacillus allorhizosphaerae]|uniref:Acyl-CoA dehydrogenase n=1 Tax=Paenibacillus allorhizosphaerae TaxID=2849866 RepID=A0ABN7TZY4_9BACL|nr:acyl-CoA dehydrogenase family protein [Paenibacillus allorhizosphaerae]CAG7657473.1 hypothetical protein PAECIP111802_06737 [Paenibacillus allorhizosphaerae]
METAERKQVIESCIQDKLKPVVRKIDAEALYPFEFMNSLGSAGVFRSQALLSETLLRDTDLIERTSTACMTTGFNLWCHLAAATYLRRTDNVYLRQKLLPLLEEGGLRGGTGLSNPMKFYAGLEKLHLKAKRVAGGYSVSGQLPMVSNLGTDHWFGIVASVEEERRIMAFVPCRADRLSMKEKLGYLALNGSATYTCAFDDVFVPDDWIVSEQADDFVEDIRPVFVLYQIPLGLGVTSAAVESIGKAAGRQGGCNRYLSIQSAEIGDELSRRKEELRRICLDPNVTAQWSAIVRLRLDTVLLTLKAVQADMLHHGGSAYLQASEPSRRLREAYFLANLTPTVKHLEKMLQLMEAQSLSAAPRQREGEP